MTVKKILCAGGALLVSSHEAVALGKTNATDEKQALRNNVEIVSCSYADKTDVKEISSVDVLFDGRGRGAFSSEYPYISSCLQKKKRKTNKICLCHQKK